MSETPAGYDVTAARAVLAAEAEERAARCLEKVQAILAEERCVITARITDSNGRVLELPVAIFAL